MLRSLLLALASLLWAVGIQAQTQAACTFNLLPMTVTTPNLGAVPWRPQGINDFGTVVGAVSRSAVDHSATVGIIRWPGGGVTAMTKTYFVARNNKGSTIGFALGGTFGATTSKPILLNGTTISDITLKGLGKEIVFLFGINKWGTIVGVYVDPSFRHGFKRWRHGGFITLEFPGSFETFPTSVNDNGTVVGTYVIGNGQRISGFIYDKGQWATLDLPGVLETFLVGITNAGVIFGNGIKQDGTTVPFLYQNGTFKVISIPNSDPYSRRLMSISPRRGLILAVTGDLTEQGFIAQCQ